jgi:hypothetical protein
VRVLGVINNQHPLYPFSLRNERTTTMIARAVVLGYVFAVAGAFTTTQTAFLGRNKIDAQMT